ncbi:hypothetical protein [Chryseobacterium sp. MP_3.2]|uniref:hypothetical protein n=1 Tax=Chryseobacterium sp. MP_3.2 TaxID=3071712 RepID=UPI002E053415|nr:hypothetical protein [Chryseobacterium sp. MP_3.2]
MGRKSLYSENSFDFFLNDIDKYWLFLKENITLLVVFLSLLGGLNQIINLILLSPSLIIYYSPQQGLLDGVLFLFFVAIFLGILLITVLSAIRVAQNSHKWVKWLSYFLSLIFCIAGLLYLTVYLNQFYLAVYIFLPLFIISHVMLSKIEEMSEGKNSIKDHTDFFEEKRDIRDQKRQGFFLLVGFSLLSFLVYFSIFYRLNANNIVSIENNLIIERKINDNSSQKYVIVYNNGLYVFLKDEISRKIMVLDVELFTKDLLLKK